MSLHFQDPALLWLSAGAVALPLVAHLVSRTRPPEMLLPTVEFLRRASQRVWRWKRPRDLIILALRTLALSALALAFARPLWVPEDSWEGASGKKHLVLVVDRTASMSAGGAAVSRFSQARDRALEALRGAGRLESVNLVWIDASPDAVFPGMGTVTAPLETALRQATVSGESGSGAAALSLALERLAATEGPRSWWWSPISRPAPGTKTCRRCRPRSG